MNVYNVLNRFRIFMIGVSYMKYGYFDDNAKEYVITRADTPLPWINYLGSDGFFSCQK